VTKLVSKRFVKKQQMQWTPRGAHLLLQIHTKMLNDNLESTFSAMASFVPACCCITPDFLADSRLPVHFALAESP
jgi:hypothetical protein